VLLKPEAGNQHPAAAQLSFGNGGPAKNAQEQAEICQLPPFDIRFHPRFDRRRDAVLRIQWLSGMMFSIRLSGITHISATST
jgi:hypothetical protein